MSKKDKFNKDYDNKENKEEVKKDLIEDEKKIDALDTLIKEKDEKIKNYEEINLRLQADFMNYKRRRDDEISKMLKYSEEQIIKEILPILDNFERAIKMDDDNLDDEVSKFLEGFKMVYTQFKNMLDKFEVKEIDAFGKEFDPTYHQAVMKESVPDKESGIVLEVFQKGYIYKDRVIRPAMVKVNE